jgi:hypothetical protein
LTLLIATDGHPKDQFPHQFPLFHNPESMDITEHMLNASGLPEFNSSYLHIATFYKTKLLLIVLQDSILQQYDATSLSNHTLAF